MGNRRSRARQYALQALYQWQMTRQDIGVVERQFLEDEELTQADVGLFVTLLRGVPTSLSRLDSALAPLLDRPLEQVDPVERAVLRIGAYELMEHLDIPYRVVINEAVELAKLFGAEQGHRYVNGVLDKLAKRLRTGETAAYATRHG
jgi:N utilization substance protein B